MRIILIAFFVCSFSFSYAQERLGLQIGNYSGINSLSLNPTGNLYNPLKWDFNLVAAGLFFDNNYGFIRNTSVLDLYRLRNDLTFELFDQVEGNQPTGTYIIDFYDLNRIRYAWVNAFVRGPSFSFKLNETHSLGLFTGARVIAGTQDLPNNFSYHKYQSLPTQAPFQVHPATGALLSWLETGINYAIKLPSPSGDVGFGINLKWLRAYEGAFVHEREEFQVTKISGTSVTMRESRGFYAFTTSNLKESGIKPVRNGGGIGVDLGFVKFIGTDEANYRLRIGASIIDLGFLTYNKNAQAHKIVVDSTVTLASRDFSRFQGIEEFPDLVEFYSEQTMGDPKASYNADKFTVFLPAAFSLQADYALSDNFFINAVLVQRMRPAGESSERTNIFALTPRYETRWIEASIPVLLLNYDQIHLGAAVRLGFLTIGSDNVTSLFGKRSFSGSDFYVALKVNPFDLGMGRVGNSSLSKKGVRCYDF